jgi:hypothetical protein
LLFVLGIALVGAMVASQLIPVRGSGLAQEPNAAIGSGSRIVQVTALVMVPSVRLLTLGWSVEYAIPVTWGLAYAARTSLGHLRSGEGSEGREMVKLALTTFAATWLAWYTLPFRRFPPVSVPAIAGWQHGSGCAASRRTSPNPRERDLRDNGCVSARRNGRDGRTAAHDRAGHGECIGERLLRVTTICAHSCRRIPQHEHAIGRFDRTYESELFLLLDRRYHYPPDPVHVELNRRTFLQQDVPIPYDPLAADPDYLVVGSECRGCGDSMTPRLRAVDFSESRGSRDTTSTNAFGNERFY